MSKLKNQSRVAAVCILGLSGLLLLLPIAHAGETKEESLDRLVVAIFSNDFEMFTSEGTEEFKNGITRKQFNAVSGQFKNLGADGYSSEYLTDLNQRGVTVYLWKLTHKDSDEEMLARMILIDGKVGGFWLQ